MSGASRKTPGARERKGHASWPAKVSLSWRWYSAVAPHSLHSVKAIMLALAQATQLLTALRALSRKGCSADSWLSGILDSAAANLLLATFALIAQLTARSRFCMVTELRFYYCAAWSSVELRSSNELCNPLNSRAARPHRYTSIQGGRAARLNQN